MDLAERIRPALADYGLGWITRTRLRDWERGMRSPEKSTQRVLLDWLEWQRIPRK